MSDSLEARLAAMPEIIADLLPYDEWLRLNFFAPQCCIAALSLYCEPDCKHAAAPGQPFSWHGTTWPTVETLRFNLPDTWTDTFTCRLLHTWYLSQPLHAPLSLDFDEETERARLMPV